MSHLDPLIRDLALILLYAGAMTLLFKKLKQPLVLGYIVAGFIASPHFSFTPSVSDSANIQTWSDIGVIFLLFALGLEFSFKKIMRVGGPAILSACAIIFCMMMVGILAGWAFGWKQMDCIYLGGMLAMSSTTIIYKAFDDMGIRQKHFTGLVLSILIIEDILAIVLMVMLSTMAVSKSFEGQELVYSILKLVFFLILWFVVGVYLIPLFLRKARKFMSDETLLIVALAFCFGMVVLAAQVGFSPAFGAFMMGSILAETLDSDRIDRLVAPVKNLFGAVFFVSVGMMVDPHMIVTYAVPIIVLVLAVVIGQTIFGTMGVLLSGQSLKTSMECGFCLTQIGEFAFIIAAMGVSLHVTSHFLYPIVVAVSVITTFLTPYMIRLADPAYNFIDKHLPAHWRNFLERYSSSSAPTVNRENKWKKLLGDVIRIVAIYLVLTVAVIILSFNILVPFLHSILPGFWGRLIGAVLTIASVAPFLRAIVAKKNHSIEFKALWADNRFNHGLLISLVLLRVVLVVMILVYIIKHFFLASAALLVGIALMIVALMIFSRFLKRQSIVMERTFVQNLRSKELQQEYLGEKKPEYAGHLIGRDLHLSDLSIPADSLWAGKTLGDLNLGKEYGVRVVSIIRGTHRINIPGADARLYPGDTIQAIGTDEQLSTFADKAEKVAEANAGDDYAAHEIHLQQIPVDASSPFFGHSIAESNIHTDYHCLVVGIESVADNSLHVPDIHAALQDGDVLWVVGEESDLGRLSMSGV